MQQQTFCLYIFNLLEGFYNIKIRLKWRLQTNQQVDLDYCLVVIIQGVILTFPSDRHNAYLATLLHNTHLATLLSSDQPGSNPNGHLSSAGILAVRTGLEWQNLGYRHYTVHLLFWFFLYNDHKQGFTSLCSILHFSKWKQSGRKCKCKQN